MTKTPRDLPLLQALRDRFAAVPARPADAPRPTIAVPLTWPDLKNAEYEVIKRFCRAADNIGARLIVTDNDGYPAWSSDGSPVDDSRPLARGDADFAISLHFESPRLTDLYSYYAIWQPVGFYFDFGYEVSTDKLITHSDALSCSADPSDAHVRGLMAAAGRPAVAPFPHLFHSPPEPYHAPAITEKSRLFYIGINWERLGQARKGRHHELLRLLDEADLVDIYGPRVFLGVQPWEGFATYRGELPFDGSSVVRALHGSGICLALSSRPHQDSGVMSNRLFEGLAAGAAIIANPHPFIDKYFADLVWTVDDTVSDEEMFIRISGIVDEIRADPAAANARARAGQERLAELFSLEKCLSALIAEHPARAAAAAARNRPAEADRRIAVILPHAGHQAAPVAAVIDALCAQEGVDLHLILVCDARFAEGAAAAAIARARDRLAKVTVVPEVFRHDAELPGTAGAALVAAAAHVTEPAFAVVRSDESFFHDHFASLACRLADAPEAMAAASRLIEEEYEGTPYDRRIRRKLAAPGLPADIEAVLEAAGKLTGGRLLFRSTLLQEINTDLFRMLDGTEVAALMVAALRKGPHVVTGRSTCLRIVPETDRRRPADVAVTRQVRFIRDMLRFDPGATVDTPVPAASPPHDSEAMPNAVFVPRLALDRMAQVRARGDGEAMLVAGFSHPEERTVWVDGTTGVLRFRLADGAFAGTTELELALVLAGRPSEVTGRTQHVTVAVNGMTLGHFDVTPAEREIRMLLPAGIVQADFLTVRITADHAEPVRRPDGGIADPRRLGFYVAGIAVFRRTPEELAELVTGAVHDFGRRGRARDFVIDGGFSEHGMTWISDGPAVLGFRVKPSPQPLLLLEIELQAVAAQDDAAAPVTLTLRIGDLPAQELRLDTPSPRALLPLPAAALGAGGACRITITPSHAVPQPGGRVFAVGLRSIRLRIDDLIVPDRIYATTAEGPGRALLREGFSAPEPGFTWIDGNAATLEGSLVAPASVVALMLGIGGRPDGNGDPHRCQVRLNDSLLGEIEVPQSGGPVRLVLRRPLPEVAELPVTIALNLARPAVPVTDPETGAVRDPRRLGLHLAAFAFETAAPAENA